MTTKPIAISLGDPAGIGPEVVVRALAVRPELRVLVFGDPIVLAAAAERVRMPRVSPESLRGVTTLGPNDVTPGRPNDGVGARASSPTSRRRRTPCCAANARRWSPAPISKEWIARAGFTFPGHTEYLASRAAGVAEFAMMLAGPKLRVVVATTHIALRDVPTSLTPAGIASTIVLTAEALARRFRIAKPRVAVAGLNPHAGEAGRFGDEETRLVAPALALARARLAAAGIDAAVTGPHVPDVVFRQAAGGAFDAVVALYHDQGLIPVKLLHFDDAVNVTLGLPFARTSPDHGTAFDIAGTGAARPDSFLAALDLAARIAG